MVMTIGAVVADARAALHRLPTGVVLVAGVASGEPVGMVVGTFTSVSVEPPLVGYLPARASRSHRLLDAADTFCASILAADQAEVSHRFSNRGGPGFSGLRWLPGPGGAPIIPGCVAWVAFVRHAVVEAGDHLLVLGAVTASGIGRPAPPLVHQDGRFGSAELAPPRTSAASAWSTAPSQSSDAPWRRAAS